MTAQGNIYGINGPIIYLKGDSGFQMNEMVYVGTGRLVGEVIGLTSCLLYTSPSPRDCS